MEDMYLKRAETQVFSSWQDTFLCGLRTGAAHEITTWKDRIRDLLDTVKAGQIHPRDVLGQLEEWL